MLNKKDKIIIFKEYLNLTNNSYADIMKEEIYFHYFENENSLSFLDSIKVKEEIISKVDLIINKMIMHEDEDSLSSIIELHT